MRARPNLSLTVAALVLAAGFTPRWASAAAGDPPAVTPGAAKTAADVQSLYDAGNHNGAVSAASHVLAKTGASAGDVDRGEVYAVKGEAHLKLKQYPQAADAFDRAAKAAADPAAAATDAATALLVRRSKNGTYTPKQPGADGTKPAPVDVTATADRKAAFAALFADEFAAAGPKLKAAKTATTVPQLLLAADTVNGLRHLELAATGADEKSGPEVRAVMEHAHGLLDTNLRTMGQRASDLEQAANKTTMQTQQQRAPNGTYYTQNVYQKAGVTSANKTELQNIQGTCQKIGPAADAFAKASAEGGGGGGSAGWDAISADATRVAAKAGDVLNADYGNGATSTGHVRH